MLVTWTVVPTELLTITSLLAVPSAKLFARNQSVLLQGAIDNVRCNPGRASNGFSRTATVSPFCIRNS